MAITTLNGVLAGFQAPQFFSKSSVGAVAGKPYSYWAVAGIPAAGTFSGSAGGATYSSTGGLVTGAIPHTDPVSGNAYLGRFTASASGAVGMMMLCDRLWDNGGLNTTLNTLQTVNSVGWPTRDNTGTANGVGVLIGLEISVAVGAGTPTITVGYTNSSGTGSRTGTNVDVTVASAVAGSFYRIGLQAGDVGVQSVQSITLSATWTSGTMNLVAYRVLAMLEQPITAGSNSIDALTSGFPQLFNGVVPFVIFVPNGATGSAITGQYVETQG